MEEVWFTVRNTRCKLIDCLRPGIGDELHNVMSQSCMLESCERMMLTASFVVFTSLCGLIFMTSDINIFNKCSATAEMGDRLATIDMGRKLGEGCATLGEGHLGPHLTQCGQG